MLARHYLITALTAQHQAELERRAEWARIHRPQPAESTSATTSPTRAVRHGRRRRRHLRLV